VGRGMAGTEPRSSTSMRIFLTGASGYIGLHLVRELLAHDHEITALVRSPEKLGPLGAAPGLRVIVADLEDDGRVARALEDQHVCVHAALVWGEEPGSELALHDTAAAAKLFDAAGRAGVGRCVFLSSASVHRPFAGEMGEDDALTTSDFYGATKAAGELFLRAACALHGMTGVVLRPGPVVGPPAFAGASFRSDRRLVELVTAAHEGRVLEGPADEGRQLSDVRGVARAARLVSEIDRPHGTYLCVGRDILEWAWIARQVLASVCPESSSELRVAPSGRRPGAPIPRFRTDRIDGLLGGPMDARAALIAHIETLAPRQAQSRR
jgi:nucleoside-diphosphate-sugar epimerase